MKHSETSQDKTSVFPETITDPDHSDREEFPGHKKPHIRILTWNPESKKPEFSEHPDQQFEVGIL